MRDEKSEKIQKNLKKLIIEKIFLKVLFSGEIKLAPGTFGSIVGAVLGFPILLFSSSTLLLASILIALIAIKQIDIFEREKGIHDDKSIVIDELVGVWISMSFVGFGLENITSSHLQNLLTNNVICNIDSIYIVATLLALLLFRIFDIIKPSFIGKIDRDIKGGLGVVVDDVLAGIVAGIFCFCIFAI